MCTEIVQASCYTFLGVQVLVYTDPHNLEMKLGLFTFTESIITYTVHDKVMIEWDTKSTDPKHAVYFYLSCFPCF